MAEPQARLDILLVEDTEKHQDSAREQLKDHTLTIEKHYSQNNFLYHGHFSFSNSCDNFWRFLSISSQRILLTSSLNS